MADLNTLDLDMRDLTRAAKYLSTVCPRLRQIRIRAAYLVFGSARSEGMVRYTGRNGLGS